ncbi:MAG: penicillin-binding protein 2 [Gammaproteobacteria bacterium]|nr:penicillin-binding protein 2 [Gammaproteobacteria bacterium]
MIENITLKDHWREQRTFVARIIIGAIIGLVLIGLVVARLVNLQVTNYEHFSALSKGNRIRIEPLPATRGLIYDRNGQIIAQNMPAYQLELTREGVQNVDETLARLVSMDLLHTSDLNRLSGLIRSRRKFEPVTLIYQMSDQDVARFAVMRQDFPGVDIRARLIRQYPYANITSHVVGYVGSMNEADLKRSDPSAYAGTSYSGKLGIERAQERLLLGKVGYQQNLVDAQGRTLQHIPQQSPLAGEDLISTLDINLQQVAYDALGEHRGAVVAIDPRNGDVLVLASTPAFDPNKFAGGLSLSEYRALQNDPGKPLFNRALRGQYPPGSTVKPLIALAGLQQLKESPLKKNYCPGYFILPDSSHQYRDWKKQGHGQMDMTDAIAESCDVYFYGLAMDLGIDQIHDFLVRFGLGAVTGIDIPGEKPGLIPSRDWKKSAFERRQDQSWYPGETVIAGIGQGYMLATPLQMAAATAVIAARGKRYRPRLVVGVRDSASGEISELVPEELPPVQLSDPGYWSVIGKAMEEVNHGPRGTGRASAAGAAYRYAGKSGTAQVFSVAQDEEYEAEDVPEHLRHHALFVAYAPAQNPEIALAVIVEHGGGGSAAAAPVARKVLDAYMLSHRQ